MKTKYLSLPVEFIENKTFSLDDSLIPVDIKVMHDGLNLNNSTFFEEAIEDARETLKNKPILGYIKKVDGTDLEDFSGHEMEVSIGDDGLKIVVLERPLGLVPESNNYSILEEDDKKFVFCRGYLWREYINSGYEILKDNPKKSVSMEIAVDDYDINDDGTINIKKYRYLGITILGDEVVPAMTGCELSVIGQFSKQKDDEFYSKIVELNNKILQFSQDNFEGGEDLADEEKNQNIEKQQDKKVEKKTKEQEVFAGETKDALDEKFTKVFELSHDDIRSKLYKLLSDIEEENNEWYWIAEVYDDYFIYSGLSSYFKQKYVKTDVDVALEGERIEVFAEFLTAEELGELKKIREDYSTLEKEVESLREFKSIKEQEEFETQQAKLKQEKIDHINTEYESIPDEIKEIFINKVDEYETIEDLDGDICVYIVKNKVVFSKAKKEKPSIKLELENDKKDLTLSPYGDLF